MLDTSDWKLLTSKYAGARKVCADDMWRDYQRLRVQRGKEAIRREWLRRKHGAIHTSPQPEAKWRPLGQQGLLDVPVDVPAEKILMDQAGIFHEYGSPWVCRKCGAKFHMGFPPDECPVCKTPSVLADKRVVNLRA